MTNVGCSKKCLLLVPKSFYSYTDYIRKEFINQGYEVFAGSHEYPDSPVGKILGKLKIPLLLVITNRIVTQKYLDGTHYDIVLIIKGRGISKPLIEKLLESSTIVIGYNFDSFAYNPAPLNWYKYVTRYYTFDYRDSEHHNLPIIELFTSLPENSNPKEFKYDVSAIVRNHSDRLRFIDRVFSILPPNNRFIYIYEQNVFTFFQNFVRNPLLYLKYKKYISFKALSYQEYTDVLHNSDFTIDCVHPTQSGISIRCFEALSSQTKLITNNPFVTRYTHFNETNTIVFTPASDPSVLMTQYHNLKNNLPSKFCRTISAFISDLLS